MLNLLKTVIVFLDSHFKFNADTGKVSNTLEFLENSCVSFRSILQMTSDVGSSTCMLLHPIQCSIYTLQIQLNIVDAVQKYVSDNFISIRT